MAKKIVAGKTPSACNAPIKGAEEPKRVIQEMDDIEMLEILSPTRELDLKLQSGFEGLDKDFSVILSVAKEQYEQTYIHLVKRFVDEGLSCVFVTLNKSSSDLLNELKNSGVNMGRVSFIDAVTSMISGRKVTGKQITYLESPSDLLGVSMSVEKVAKKLEKEKCFVIFDSLTTLAIYNNEVAVEKFVHSIVQKAKGMGCKSIFLAAKSTNEGLMTTLAQFFDAVLTI